MASIQRFIEWKLRLKVNEKKTAVERPWKRKFLGFSFTSSKEPKVRIAKESLKRMKQKVREITSRKMPYSMEYRIQKMNQYLIGWCGYFALADTKTVFSELDGWIRRRLRMCLWKNWKKPKTKVRNLINLGVPEWKAYEWEIAVKAIGEFRTVQYYTKPSTIPIGIIEGLKVYKSVINSCVNYLN